MLKAFLAIVAVIAIAGCQAPPQRASYVPSSSALPLTRGPVVIYSFSGPPLGEIPEANPILDSAGRLYGTTSNGGTNTACSSGCGTIFRLSHGASGWNETTLWSFDLTNGAYPDYPLVSETGDDFYGTTQVGGSLGVAYALYHRARSPKFGVLHDFMGNRDGAQPRSALIFDKRGNLYGTTVSGGSGGSGGGGTVYELVRSGKKWAEKILYRFTPYGADGANPQAPPLLLRGGNLYGTTSYGGNTACAAGCGVVFKLTPSAKKSWTETVLHAFNGSDGYTPVAGLVADDSGNLYGSANLGGRGGCFGGCGTLFKLARGKRGQWSFRVIHYFKTSEGGGPLGNMAVDASGNLYGTANIGGNVNACPSTKGCGVVFKLAPQGSGWAYTVLYAFTNTPDGALPTGVTLSTAGNLYGTTIGGGTHGLGTVFAITP